MLGHDEDGDMALRAPTFMISWSPSSPRGLIVALWRGLMAAMLHGVVGVSESLAGGSLKLPNPQRSSTSIYIEVSGARTLVSCFSPGT